jgi:sigma-B regulation protein RsbU (phosphoserine phosphatase)
MPMQVGYIANCIEPFNIVSDTKWTDDWKFSGKDTDVIPFTRHGVILGIVKREDAGKLHGSFLSRILGKKDISSLLMPVKEFIDASSYINTVVERGLKTSRWDDPAWYVVEHKKKYFGIVNLRQMMEYLDGIRARDLLRAGEIQKNLLIQPVMCDPRLVLLTYNRMAYEVGGDWYKTLQINKDLYLIGCFDVAGKNVSGSLVTMSLGTCFATLGLISYEENNPEKTTSLLNALIRTVSPPDVFVAAVLLYIDFSRMAIEIHNCGLSPVVVFFPMDEKRIGYKTFAPNLPPLGLEEEIKPDPPQKISIAKGLRVAVHSDGLMDMCDIHGERYGEERVLEFLQNLHYIDGEGFTAFVNRELDLWAKDTALADDVTLLDMRFTPAAFARMKTEPEFPVLR